MTSKAEEHLHGFLLELILPSALRLLAEARISIQMGSQVSAANVGAAAEGYALEHSSAEPPVDGVPGDAADLSHLCGADQLLLKDVFHPSSLFKRSRVVGPRP